MKLGRKIRNRHKISSECKLEVETYKSRWTYDYRTGNFSRQLKPTYPLEFLANLIPKSVERHPVFSKFVELVANRKQGSDFYDYYKEVIELGARGKWDRQFAEFSDELNHLLPDWKGIKVLDVSGEPGFFALDAEQSGANCVVTGLNTNVVREMSLRLGLDSVVFDYQRDDIGQLARGSFDLISVRYSIGFCLDLLKFARECFAILDEGGLVYISHSPPSRAIMARWMFDDYTYLRLYSRQFIVDTFEQQGFQIVEIVDHGSYHWRKGLHPAKYLLALPYLRRIFSNSVGPEERFQHNEAIIFRKVVAMK